jgi:hypothetical protein
MNLHAQCSHTAILHNHGAGCALQVQGFPPMMKKVQLIGASI